MFRRLVVALSVILATGVFVSAEARKQRYDDGERLVVISEQDIDLSLDKYSIDVGKAKGAYKAIRVRNAQGRLFDLQRVQIVYSDGSAKPYRLHVRGPSFHNMFGIARMSQGHMLSDVVTCIASIDPVLGEVDR